MQIRLASKHYPSRPKEQILLYANENSAGDRGTAICTQPRTY
jgi:hypothetical protein